MKKLISKILKSKKEKEPIKKYPNNIKPIENTIKKDDIDNNESILNRHIENKKYGKVVSLEEYRRDNTKLCKSCSGKLHKDDCRVSATHKDGYYYMVCSCGFVNKVVKGKVVIPKISEVKISKELLSLNGYNFTMYSKNKGGEKINIE